VALGIVILLWLLLAFRLVRWLSNSLFGLEVWYDDGGPNGPLAAVTSAAAAGGDTAPAHPSTIAKRLYARAAETCRWLLERDAQLRLDRLLRDECGDRFPKVAEQIRHRPDAMWLTREQVIEHVGDLVRERHAELWKQLPQSQRLALVQLAQEGFVNPRNWDVIRDAARKGFVRRAPALRFVSESFQRFVATAELPSTIAKWEEPESAETWFDMRTVAGLVLIGAACFMVFTQPDVVDSWVGVASGVVGAVPVFMKLLGLAGNRSGDASAAKA
jgi:hypothetical protein